MIRLPALRLLRGLGAMTVVGALLASGGFSPGQQPKSRIGQGQETLPIDRDWDKDGKDEAKQFESLRKGEQPLGPDSKAILENGAKWYAYRLTHAQYQESTSTGRGMHDLVKQAVLQIIDPHDPRKQPNQQQILFMDEFDKLFIPRLAEVMKNRKEIARLNAAMILAQLAASGQEEAADILVETIQDPAEHEAVRLYAFRGLKDLFALGRGDNPDPFKNKDREFRAIDALLAYLATKPAKPTGTAPEEKMAQAFVRAEAIAALGETRFPAVCETVNKKTEIKRPTALVLLRLIRRDGAPFELSILEEVRGAVAVCELRSKLCEEYQPDYAAYHLGRFVVDFVNQFNATKDKHVPWKILSVQLVDGLSNLVADTGRTPKAKYIAKLAEQAKGPLINVINGSSADARPLSTWLDNNPPDNKTLFKDDAKSVVKEAAEKVSE